MADLASDGIESGKFEAPNSETNPLVTQLSEWVKRRTRVWERRFKEGRRNRKITRGEMPDKLSSEQNESARLVRVNLILSTIDGLFPHIYSRNPEIAVSPSEAAADVQNGEGIRNFAKTLQTLLARRFVRDGQLKKRIKRSVRAALTSRIGWVKLVYQVNFQTDPYVRSRVDDTFEDIAELDRLRRALVDGAGGVQQEEAKRAEMETLMTSLSMTDTVVAEGIALDCLRAEHVILDTNIDALEDYASCRQIVQQIMLQKDEAEERFGRKLEHATTFWISDDGGPGSEEEARAGGSDRRGVEFIRCYEAWNRKLKTVFTMVSGERDFVRPPWQPARQGERWYPYFPLAFYVIDGYVYPLALPDLLAELQDEYISTRTQLAEHRELSIPHWIADKGSTNLQSLQRYRDAALGEIVLVDAKGRPLRQVIESAEPPPFNPALYDTLPIRSDFDMLSGLQDANRGTVMQAKTATEAEILQAGFSSRTTMMQDTIEDFITDLAQYAAEVLLQEQTKQQVVRAVGQNATWPLLDKEHVFDLVQIEVRAGTSGRPDKNRERQQWGEVLPVIVGLIEKAEQRVMMGLDPRPFIELLRRTLDRFDERMELEEILPQHLIAYLGVNASVQPMVGAMQQPVQQPGGPVSVTGASGPMPQMMPPGMVQ